MCRRRVVPRVTDTMFKFLHAADLHLDSPLRGLARYEGAPVERLRNATRQALANLVELAIEEKVAFVLIAGDVYDGDWDDYHTGLYFIAQMARLREAEIPVYLIAGNHDAQSKMTRSLRLPETVHVFPTRAPATIPLEELGVAIHGQGFATAAVRENLSAAYPMAQPGCYNIGLLHTSATGREGHENYAPCTFEGLRAKGYDYWALGHVHHRETDHADGSWIVFPGNLQGRCIRETGPKGCVLVTVDDAGRSQVEPRWLDVLRWERCRVDLANQGEGDARDGHEALDRFRADLERLVAGADGRSLAVRVEFHGICAAHEQLAARPEHWINEVRAAALDLGAEQAWIEKVRIRSRPVGATLGIDLDGPLGELTDLIGEYRDDVDRHDELGAELAELRSKLPPELREGPESLGLDLDDPERVRALLGEVQALLTTRLLDPGDAE